MRYDNNLRAAISIIKLYKGTTPLAIWLREYFRQNKQMGSSDRKLISSLIYSYFRLGNSLNDLTLNEKLLSGFFLTNTQSSPFLKYFKPLWDHHITNDLDSKLSFLKSNEGLEISGKIFPFNTALSAGIDVQKFEDSFLIQPDLFIRVRPGNKELVLGKLSKANIPFNEVDDYCIALSNATKTAGLFHADVEAIIQDYNSQQTGSLLKWLHIERKNVKVWDCCAGSGGKSIMTFDINPGIQLTVSDKRSMILDKLSKRFATAGILEYNSYITDLTISKIPDQEKLFDLIICDAPCTGSGTWARTPEQLHFFKEKQIDTYSIMQKDIVRNVLPYLAPGGKFLYITCSVFRKENEEVTDYLVKEMKLKLQENKLLKGYDLKADTLYAALLINPEN